MQVSRSRRRTIRFTVALILALALSGGLVYTTFSAASPERFPEQLATGATPGKTYRLGGRVVAGSVSRTEGVLRFRLAHPGTGAGKQVSVEYRGTVPDPFREGRDILIDVRQANAAPGAATTPAQFVGEADSLVTKCPSKFNGETINPASAAPAATPAPAA